MAASLWESVEAPYDLAAERTDDEAIALAIERDAEIESGVVVFTLAAVINRTGIAAAAFLGVLTAGSGIAARVAEASFSGARWVSLLALDQHPRIIRDHLFEDTVDYPSEIAGFEVWMSVVVIAVLVLAGATFVRQRYRRLA